MAGEDVIVKNYWEYKEIADYSFSNGKYNAAVTLYYKALVELCDVTLLRTLGRIGANHSERFAFLEDASPSLYRVASKLFRFYRDSYNKEISESVAAQMKREVEDAEATVLTG
jgi:hypothetical protein